MVIIYRRTIVSCILSRGLVDNIEREEKGKGRTAKEKAVHIVFLVCVFLSPTRTRTRTLGVGDFAPRVLHMNHKHTITQLHPQPLL